MFGVYGVQGADKDPEKVFLLNPLFQAVCCEAMILGNGELLLIGGDFHVDPRKIVSHWLVCVGGLTWKRLSRWE